MRGSLASWLALGAVALSLSSCESCRDAPAAPEAQAALPPVPAPPGVVAEITLATPDATWARVQRSVGGVIALMAPTAGGVLASVTGADAAIAGEIDGASGAYAVITDSGWVLAARLKSDARARTLLAQKATPRAGTDEQGITIYATNPYATGVTPSYLLVGSDARALGALGPYAYRTLPTRPLPKSNLHVDLGGSAFAVFAERALEKRWEDARAFLLAKNDEQKRAHGGRSPDFGDAEAIVAALGNVVRPRIDAIADVRRGAIDLDARDDGLSGALVLEPGDGASKAYVASLRASEAPIGEVPADSFAVLALRSDEAEREATMKAIADGARGALGARLSEGDAKDLEAALGAWAKARGDWTCVAIGARGALVRAPAKEGASKSVRDLVALAAKPAFKAPLEAGFGVKDVRFSTFGQEGTLATLERRDDKLGIGWTTTQSRIDVALSSDPRPLLDGAGDDAFARAIERAGPASVVFAGRAGQGDAISSLAIAPRDGKLAVVLDLTPIMARRALSALTD